MAIMMGDEEFGLSPLLSLDVESPFADSRTPSIAMVPRPIAKRRGKKRGSRACTTCRARKVRCNIVAHGAPCSNCRHDEIECILPLSRRQRSARERAEQSLRNSMMGSEAGERRSGTVEFESCTTHSQHDNMSRFQDQQWEKAQSQSLGNLTPHGMDISDHPLSEIIPPPSTISSIADSQPPTSWRTKSWIQIQAPLASAPKSAGESTALPRVFLPFPRHFAAADISYLQSRDALTLPSESLQIELLKAYVEFVHGSMPLLDLEEFLSTVKYGTEGLDGQRCRGIERENVLKKQVPLLLFQAVMFASVGFVSLKALRNAGYQSHDIAKRVFFSRVRLCYDFDTSRDRQSTIQSLLLMTLSYPSPSLSAENKDAYHWLGLAITLAYSLGLNRTSHPTTTLRKKRLERRIWWTAFVRDRTLALSPAGTFARPIRIRTEDYDVQMLCLADFDLSETEENGEEMRERVDAEKCIEKAMVCRCSNDGAVSHFEVLNSMPQVQPPQNITIPEPLIAHEQQIYTSTSFSSAPLFESEESYSSLSLLEDCHTPHMYHEPVSIMQEKSVAAHSPLGGGFGVDGEYDDYLEYLKDRPEIKGKERELSTWPFQLDCGNDCVLDF